MMIEYRQPFSGFSVRDTEQAAAFYRDVLGLAASVDGNGLGRIDVGGEHFILFYPKGETHEPASFTILNLPVADVTSAVAELASRGVEFVRYDGMPQDADGVMRGHGPDIAWLTDPSGNVISVVAAD